MNWAVVIVLTFHAMTLTQITCIIPKVIPLMNKQLSIEFLHQCNKYYCNALHFRMTFNISKSLYFNSQWFNWLGVNYLDWNQLICRFNNFFDWHHMRNTFVWCCCFVFFSFLLVSFWDNYVHILDIWNCSVCLCIYIYLWFIPEKLFNFLLKY